MPSHAAVIDGLRERLRDARLYLPNPTLRNPAWVEASPRVLVVRLSPFADVERSATHGVLAAELRAALPSAFVDLAFLPHRGDLEAMRGAGLPPLLGTQSCRPLDEFDLALVSNSWLLEQVNLPFLLEASGVPAWASARGERWPVIVGGGANAAAAHALARADGDCVADALFFGEGEDWIGAVARLIADDPGAPKRERLARAAAEVPGLWAAGSTPARVHPVHVGAARLAARGHVPGPVFPGPEAATARLSITRGCPCHCSFCFEGFDRKPSREVPVAALLAQARDLKRASGADTLEVDSFNFTTHPGIAELLPGLHRMFLRVNLMSQRVDILARTPGLAALESAAGKASHTLGIEGISVRMRAFLHKSVTTDDVRRALGLLHGLRTREIKLFYVLAGRETSEDVEEFAGFVKELKAMRERAASLPRVVFSFGMLVRMPGTPLRHDAPVLDAPAWRRLAGRVKSACETHGFEFRLSTPWPDYAATQALALGGHEAAGLLVRLAARGPVTDEGLPPGADGDVEEWIAAHREALDGEKPLGHDFGFGFLEDEASRAALYRRWERAKEGVDRGYCRLGTGGDAESCAACTGCTRSPARDAGRSSAAAVHGAVPALAALVDAKRRIVPVHVPVVVPREAAGMGARWIDAVLLRAALSEGPAQEDNVLSLREAVMDGTGILGEDIPWYGVSVAAATAWDAAAWLAARGSRPLPPGAAEPSRVRVRLVLPAARFADPAASLAAWLRDAHAPVTVARVDGAAVFTVPPQSRKKKMLQEGRCRDEGDRRVLELVLGPKPFLEQWLSGSYGRGSPRRALVEVLSVGGD